MTESLNEKKAGVKCSKGILAMTPSLAMVTPATAFAAGSNESGGIAKEDKVSITDGGGGMSLGGKLGQSGDATSAFNKIITKVRVWILAIFGLAMLWMLGNFIWHFTSLAATSSNPKNRPEHIKALGFDFVCTAGLGSLAWIAGMAYNGLA